jgi:sirohydrochlorin cobaltochelatase
MSSPVKERRRGIVLFAHGARDPLWADPMKRLAKAVAARDKAAAVVMAFLEHIDPPLEAAVADLLRKGVWDITVVPVFIAQGGHLKNDLPRIIDAIRAAHPKLVLRLAVPVGESDAVLAAMADHASAASHGVTGGSVTQNE